MRRFKQDMQKYYRYATYSAKSQLKAEVAGSHLNWLWWILEPVCFMLVYTLVFGVILGQSNSPTFPVFVFIGLTNWTLFNRTMTNCVRIVKMNKNVVTKVYLPKFILVEVRLFVNLFKMLIQVGIIFIMLLIFQVPFSLHFWNIIPSIFILSIITFGCAIILMHFGVFVEDLENIIRVVLQLLFYLTGVFYDLESKLRKIEFIAPYASYIVKMNPIAFFNDICRMSLLEGTAPNAADYITMGLWLIVGIGLVAFGARLVYKYENSYAKII